MSEANASNGPSRPQNAFMSASFYILRLRSGQLYVGATTDLERRWQEHVSGDACRTSRLDPPVAIVYTEEFTDFPKARRREAQVKRWSRAKREALVAGDRAALKHLARSHDQVPLGRPPRRTP